MTALQQADLISVLKKTHREAARRENASTQVLIGTWESNGNDLIGAITAALQTFGGKHAPIKDTYQWIEYIKTKLNGLDIFLRSMHGEIIPGFGSSFVKDDTDPILWEIDSLLFKCHPGYSKVTNHIEQWFLATKGKRLYPNLAFYTAAVAIELGINIDFCEHLMIEARIEAWTEILKERRNAT